MRARASRRAVLATVFAGFLGLAGAGCGGS